MTDERDDYMRRQEADHDLLRMRSPALRKETVDPRALLVGTTPWPWDIGPWEQSRRTIMCPAGPGRPFQTKVIAHVFSGIADDRLIAAAPQLALTCISQEERIAELTAERDIYHNRTIASDAACAEMQEMIAELEGALRGLLNGVTQHGMMADHGPALKAAARAALTNTGEAK